MKVSRREFIKVGSLLLSAAYVDKNLFQLLRPLNNNLALGSLSLPILQTFTNHNSAQFRVLTESKYAIHYSVENLTTQTELPVTVLDRFIQPSWPDSAMDHLFVQNLQSGSKYRLLVRNASTGDLVDERFFTNLEPKRKVKTAIISCCCDDFPAVQAEMWKVVSDQDPDQIFFVGDATYLDGRDSDDEKGMWRRHLEVRRAFDLFRWKNLKPVISVWDDHDFGINDGDSSFPLKEATRQMFEAMFGSTAQTGLERGPSLSLQANLGGQRFFLMDNRFYRTKNVVNASHWGEAQEEWLFSQIQKSSEPLFLMSGSQYFGGYSQAESFEREQPQQFQRVLQRLSKEQSSTVLVSGDRHFSELMKIEKNILGYDTLEITSSSLHSYKPDGPLTVQNPRRFAHTIDYNFVLIESEVVPQGHFVQLKALGPAGSVLMNHQQIITR